MVFIYKNVKRLALIATFFLSVIALGQQPGVVRCYTDEMHAIRMQNQEGAESLGQFETWLQDQLQNQDASKVLGGVYQIPVVVHVIHNGEAVGSGTNVSLAAIQSQIDVLNEDFRRIFGSNGYNTNPLGADTQIEFCLAQRRPDGSAFPTEPGVNRINRTTAGFTAPPYTTTYIDATIKPYTYNNNTPAIVSTWARGWDPNKYMNIWLCNISGGVLGYAQFPESPLGGMGCGTQSAATDGVVFLYNSIGKSSVTGYAGPYNEGRTATHEIGHWLGLRHIWGDGGCTVDDFCNDTPEAAAANFGCPTINSCTNAPDPGNDMVANYMDYTDDLCMDIFTIDQKARMRTVLENSPRRLLLINSDACTPPAANDASVVDIITPKGDNCSGSLTPQVTLKNRGSSTLTSCVINYKIDNGSVTTFTYSGSLASGATANVTLPSFTTYLGTHTITSWSTLPNTVADPNPGLDTTQLGFVVSNGITGPYTENFDGQVFPPDLRWVVENPNGDCYEWISGSGVGSTGTFNNNAALFPGFGDAVASPERLISPIFILPCNATAATLNFNVAYRRKNATTTTYDTLYVDISEDCGNTWNTTPVFAKGGTALDANATTLATYFQPAASTDWQAESINLLPFVTSTSKNIKFRFRAPGKNGNNIYVDDVTYNVTQPAEAKVTVSSVEILDGGGYTFATTAACNTTTATFTVNNTGSSALTLTGPINVTGTGFALGTTFGSTTVAAGGSTTFTLTFSPTVAGSFSGTVSFGTNDCDEGTYDFQIFGTATAGSCTVANFTMNPNPVCQGQTVTFTNTSSGATTYAWNFGTGATPASATTAGPHSVTYSSSGPKTVTLQINGTGPTSTQTLTVNALPTTPTITAGGPTTFCSGGSVTLTATAGATSYLWSNGATTQSITVTTSGSYTVQVTNASGCLSAASAATVVTVNPAPATPTITAGGPTTFCSGGSVTLTSSATTGNTWSTGATTQSITVSAAGSYTVTVTSAGCSATSAATAVTVNALPTTPTITAGGPTTFCSGGSVTLTAPASTSYLWSTGATTQSITVTTSGSYTVQVTNASGCQSAASAATVVTVNPAPATPTITAGGPTTFCSGGSVTLTSSATTGNTWSTGATTQSITVSASGSYTVTVTSAGCSATSAATAVTVNALPTTPTITAGGPTTFCSGGSVTLTAPASTSYLWSTGATTQSITVTTSGSYTVQVTNASGCQSAASAATVVTVNPAPATPTITAGGPTTFCSGGSVTLTSSATTGNTWSTGATTQSITVSAAGSYTVTVTSGGCSATSAATAVTVNALPAVPTITASGATTFCSGGSVTLTAPAGATSYLWSTGATTQAITVTTSGSYTVTVSNASGCTRTSAATTVTVNPTPATPTITAGGPLTFCSPGSVTLTSSSASGNTWSTGATTQSITVSASGSYTVTVTSGGCSATSTATVVTATTTPTTPTITASGATTFCSGNTVTLTSSAGSGNTWSTGATTPSITVSSSGTYSVTVGASGCSATSTGTTVTVNALPTTPTITASGSTTFCSGGSVTLSAPTSTSYLWSTGATTQSITVSTSGSYSVQVTNASGCQSAASAATTVTVNALPTTPTITASGSTTFCTGGSVTLTAPTSTSYLWSTGATTQSITVSTSGSYSVQVTNASGCQSAASAATTVTVNALPTTPTITASGSTTFCTGGSVTLTAPTSSSYLWSTGATTQSITVSTSGSYSVQVTNASGCQSAASAATTVTVNALPTTPTITASGSTTFCSGGSVTLTAPTSTSYLWSTGATTQSITVSTSGSYSVQVTNASGCQSAASAATTVTVNSLPTTPTITASGSTTFCTGGSVTLTAPTSTSYLWSTGATTQSITVSTSGSYSVQVTNASGCQSAASAATTVTVNALPTTPTITASGSTTFCSGGSVTLTAPTSTSYLWSDGSTTQSITVSTSGSYSVQVTNASGCQSAASAATTVTVNALPATPSIVASGATTFCSGGSVSLTAPTSTSYLWSDGSTTQSITVSNSGSYSVQVTDAAGCTSLASSPTTVTVNAVPATPSITASGATTICAGNTVTLSAPTEAAYLWSDGSTTQSITVGTSGTYSVQVTNASGCQSASSSPVTVTVNALPATPTITASGSTQLCGNSVDLTSSSPSGNTWSTGETSLTITVSTAGSYVVTVTDGNGCSATSAPVVVTTGGTLPTPVITTSGSTTFCEGRDVVLISSSATGNVWSTGETTQAITVTAAGNYTLFVDNGVCTSNPTGVTVTVNANPTVTLGNIPMVCIYNSAVTLDQGAPVGGVYSGTGVSGTTFDPAVAGLGAYIIDYEYTDANGCSGIAQNTIIVDECLSIDELSDAISVYPNPTSDVIFVENLPSNTVIEMIDAFGKLVQVSEIQNESGVTELDVHDFATGIYYVRFKSNEGVSQVAISVNH